MCTIFENHEFQVHEYIAKCNNEKPNNDDNVAHNDSNDSDHDIDVNSDVDSDVESEVDKDDDEEVIFPTARKIHEEIQKIDGIPKWHFTTTYRILLAMGFRYSCTVWKFQNFSATHFYVKSILTNCRV